MRIKESHLQLWNLSFPTPDMDVLYHRKNIDTYLHDVLQMCNRVLQVGAMKDIWGPFLQIKKRCQIRAYKQWSPHVLEQCVCIHPTWAWRRNEQIWLENVIMEVHGCLSSDMGSVQGC